MRVSLRRSFIWGLVLDLRDHPGALDLLGSKDFLSFLSLLSCCDSLFVDCPDCDSVFVICSEVWCDRSSVFANALTKSALPREEWTGIDVSRVHRLLTLGDVPGGQGEDQGRLVDPHGKSREISFSP